MGQVTIYLEDNLEVKMRAMAKSMKLSQSKWIADLIREKLNDEWDPAVIALAGAWQDFPSLEEIRADMALDGERETF